MLLSQPQWVPSTTIMKLLLTLQAVLDHPEPDDNPEDPAVSRQCKQKPDVFHRTAQYWAHIFADGSFMRNAHVVFLQRLTCAFYIG